MTQPRSRTSAARPHRRRHAARAVRSPLAAGLAAVATLLWHAAVAAGADDGGPAVPAWLYPAPSAPPAAEDPTRPLHVPDSPLAFTRAQLSDLFAAPDWRPGSHAAMPPIVAHGRAPEVYACGYCHTPTGQGRPENAPLAGLPAPYIARQVADFKSGARRAASRGAYRPSDAMVDVAVHARAEEVASAAEYFAAQTLQPRVRVLERARVPRARVVGFVYVAVPGAGDEPLAGC